MRRYGYRPEADEIVKPEQRSWYKSGWVSVFKTDPPRRNDCWDQLPYVLTSKGWQRRS